MPTPAARTLLLLISALLVVALAAGALWKWSFIKEMARNLVSKETALRTAPNVDINQYLGTWYSLYEFPAWFQEGCTCTKAEYSLRPDGSVRVVNSCLKDGVVKSAEAVAVPAQPGDNSRLLVRFNRFATGKYDILHVESDYSLALVGTPDRNYLWILSRNTSIDAQQLAKLKAIAEGQGFDTTRLRKVAQACP